MPMESPLSNVRMHWDHEPERVGVPGAKELMTIADRGSLAPQRGEGSRVRDEIA